MVILSGTFCNEDIRHNVSDIRPSAMLLLPPGFETFQVLKPVERYIYFAFIDWKACLDFAGFVYRDDAVLFFFNSNSGALYIVFLVKIVKV